MRQIIYLVTFFCLSIGELAANEYNASVFGCVSDGQTNNTQSIQAAIDTISSRGGGTLHFYVGRYLTGGFELKSNVTIHLHEGAALIASPTYYDYLQKGEHRYFIYGENQTNCGIEGKGMIVEQAELALSSIAKQKEKNIISPPLADLRPTLIGLHHCKNIRLAGIQVDQAIGRHIYLQDCQNIALQQLILTSNQVSDGIVLHQSQGVQLHDLYVDIQGKPLVGDRKSQISTIKNSIKPNGKSI